MDASSLVYSDFENITSVEFGDQSTEVVPSTVSKITRALVEH